MLSIGRAGRNGHGVGLGDNRPGGNGAEIDVRCGTGKGEGGDGCADDGVHWYLLIAGGDWTTC